MISMIYVSLIIIASWKMSPFFDVYSKALNVIEQIVHGWMWIISIRR